MQEYAQLPHLRQMAAEQPQLEAKLQKLREQRKLYADSVTDLRMVCRQEQKDVDRLEGRSLANYFFRVVGKLDGKLDRERQEAYAAKVKLDAAEFQLADIDREIAETQARIQKARIAEAHYRKELEKKRAALKADGASAGAQILELEEQIAILEAQEKEVREAISAGSAAMRTAERILRELNSADTWNTMDMLSRGSVVSHMAKHSHLDDAQDMVQVLQRELRRFDTELADVRISTDVQVNIDGFLRFSDFFFDGLFVDWAVGKRIGQSQSSVSGTLHQLRFRLGKLEGMKAAIDSELAKRKARLDGMVADA